MRTGGFPPEDAPRAPPRAVLRKDGFTAMARGKSKKPVAKASLLASRAMVGSLGRQAGRTLRATASEVSRATAPARVAAAKKVAPLSEAARHRLREMTALALFAIAAFLLLACASAFSEQNLCGRTGEAVGRMLLGGVGYASYLLVLCLVLWAVALFTRRDPEGFSMKASGLILCLVSFSGLLGHFFADASGHFPAGGVVGEFINRQLMVTGGLGVAGTRIALLVVTLITFALAADVAYYTSLVAATGWLRERKQMFVTPGAPAPPPRATVRELDSGREVEVDVDPAPVKLGGRGRGAPAPQPTPGPSAPPPRAPKRGWLSRLLRRPPAGPASGGAPDAAALQPFEVLQDIPAASIPLDEASAPASRRRASRAADEAAPANGAKARPDGASRGKAAGKAAERDAMPGESDAEAKAAGRAEAKASARRGRPEPVQADDELEDDEELDDEEFEADDEEAEDEAPKAARGPRQPAQGGSGAIEIEMPEDDVAGVPDPDQDLIVDDIARDERLAAAARSTPLVKRPAQDSPVQRSLVPDLPPAAGAAPAAPGSYVFPTEDLLDDQTLVDQGELDHLLAEKTEILERTLASFRIEAKVVEIQKGPVISMFEMELAPGIKVEKVRSLEDDLAIALRARTVRIVAPIPGKNTIGIEVPNPIRETVRMKPLLRCREFVEGKYALPILLGRDASGRPMVNDLAKMPHLLVAGATGSGKSVCLNTIIVSLLYTRTPEQVKLILIDPKMVELSQFANAPHLASPVVSDMKRAPGILEWAITKMEERYRLLSQAGVRNIYSYNKLGDEGLRPAFGERVDDPDFPRFLPFVVIVIDELADLMLTSAKEVETSISRLAAKSRAVGIHMIVATQRPSTNVITGLIKANLPTRIAFMVSSKIDSRVILDENGAEQLLGEGDLLVMSPAHVGLVRGQGTYLSEEEVKRVMELVRQAGGPAYEPDLVQRRSDAARDPDSEDDLYDAAVRFVFSTERGSASLLQRKFAIGYTRASRLIDMMAEEGVLGEYKGSQARELTLTLDEWIALKPEARGAAEEGPGEPA